MRPVVRIENIEEMRRCEGVEDVELCRQIHQLAAGDVVRLTFLNGDRPFPGEVVPVRITSIKGTAFRGKILKQPTSAGLAALRVGGAVTFTAANIHSVVKHD